MTSNKKINSKFLHTLNFHHHNHAHSLLSSLTAKILRIQGPSDLHHPSMRDAVALITRNEFRKNFLKSGKTFVINLVVNGSLVPLDVQQLTALADYKNRPMIFHFENVKGDFCIYYKEKEAKNLKYLSKINEISVENFFNSEFNFELLLRALKSNFCGNFSGKLLETTVSGEPMIDDHRLIDLAVMDNDVLCIRYLQLFENCLERLEVGSLRILQHAARYCDEEGFLAVFDANFECKEVKSKINKNFLTIKDSEYNLLMIAAESSNINGVMFLLNLSTFDVNYSVGGVTAASLTKSPEIILMLLQNDSRYPKNFHKIAKSEELKLFFLKISELHKAIQDGDHKCAKEILYNFRLQFFFNETNKSAAFAAIECKQFKIYEYLLMNGATVAPSENIEEIQLDENSRLILKYIHEKYKSPLYEKCVLDLERKVKSLNVSDINRQKFQFELRNSLNLLFDIPHFRPLLQIAAASDLEIVMDFERNSVNFIDPTEVKGTRGYFGSSAIYIGAKDLLDNDLRNLFLATFVHELTHFVMHFLYGNQCRPYYINDKKREKDFEIVHEICKRNAKFEKLIEAVYGYDENLQHSELIVRPNHLVAFYFDNEVMRRESEENFKELFGFYMERIHVDMESALEWIEGDETRGCEEDGGWRKKRKYAEVYKDIGVEEHASESCENLVNGDLSSYLGCTDLNNNSIQFEPHQKSDLAKIPLDENLIDPSELTQTLKDCNLNLPNSDLTSFRKKINLKNPQTHHNYSHNLVQLENLTSEASKPLLSPLAHSSKQNKSKEVIRLIPSNDIESLSEDLKKPKNYFLPLKITIVVSILFLVPLILFLNFKSSPKLPEVMQLTSSSCINFTHPLREFIESKNITAIEKGANEEMWMINSDCNLLQFAIENHGDNVEFIEDLVGIAEEIFENCQGKLKKLLTANGKILQAAENYEKVKNFIKRTLKDLLSAEEFREVQSGKFERLKEKC